MSKVLLGLTFCTSFTVVEGTMKFVEKRFALLWVASLVLGCSKEPTKPHVQELVETLSFTTEPPGVAIFIDGQPYGATPKTLSPFPLGQHSIELRLDGYLTWMKLILLSKGQTVAVEVPMRRYPPGQLFIAVGSTVRQMKTDGSDGRDVFSVDGLSQYDRLGFAASPDGRYFAYRTSRGQLRIVNQEGVLVQSLDESFSIGTYQWSRDSRAILYEGYRDGIYLLRIGAVEPTCLVRSEVGRVGAPGFSPDGEMIAFIEDEIPGDAFWVKTMTKEGVGVTTVFSDKHPLHPGANITVPQWIDNHQFIFAVGDIGLFHSDLRTKTILRIRDPWLGPYLAPGGKTILCDQAYPWYMFFVSTTDWRGNPDYPDSRLPMGSRVDWSSDSRAVVFAPGYYKDPGTVYMVWLGDPATYQAFIDARATAEQPISDIAWRP